jgi:hypothetical protein
MAKPIVVLSFLLVLEFEGHGASSRKERAQIESECFIRLFVHGLLTLDEEMTEEELNFAQLFWVASIIFVGSRNDPQNTSRVTPMQAP